MLEVFDKAQILLINPENPATIISSKKYMPPHLLFSVLRQMKSSVLK
jgi:hypothetical protein